ncbi:MAG TPA: 50S ribosomal protein L9 [Bacteroidetes bacterium]|nr:50S ribosomal protein L9 [Bacteroidota bacterium]
MEIILLKNIEKVGRKFDIVTVKNGYGRNYLIPQGLALLANKANRNNLESFKRQEAAKLEKMLDHFKEIAAKVNDQTITLPMKCGVSGKIFGSVTTLMLANALREQLGVEVDRRDILLPDDAKMVGTYTATLDLHPDVDATIEFTLEADDPKIAALIAENQAKEAAEAAEEAEREAARKAAMEAEAAEKAAAEAAQKAKEEAAAAETTSEDTTDSTTEEPVAAEQPASESTGPAEG